MPSTTRGRRNPPHRIMTRPHKDRPRMIQLDSLRCFAVALVLFQHFAPFDYPEITKKFPWGDVGVQLFFVLSGYLITGILLDSRTQVEKTCGQFRRIVKQFYIRRFLRIFPLYYGVLTVSALLDVQPVREGLAWHYAYLTNFYFASIGDWSYTVTHFWTLAVEVQYYLLWPLLILFLPRRLLIPSVLLTIGLAPIYRLLSVLSGANELAIYTLLPANMDALGMGSLLAILSRSTGGHPEFAERLLPVGAFAGLALFGSLTLLHKGFGSFRTLEPVLSRTGMALFFVWLVHEASNGFRGLPGRLLQWRPFVYLGKISYGIYVYHLFAFALIQYLIGDIGLSFGFRGANILCWSGLTVLMAALSFPLFERPITDLKRHFRYAGK